MSAAQSAVTTAQQSHLLTIRQLAELLNMTPRQVYELTRRRGRALPVPVPLLRINGNIRFRKADIERWLDEVAEHSAKVQ